MSYSLEQLQIDVGVTPFENMFFNSFFLFAPAEAVRVYLYAYKRAYNRESLTHDSLAKDLGLSRKEVDDIWSYWEDTGIIKKQYDASDYSIEFLSLRQLYLEELSYKKPYEHKDINYQADTEALAADAQDTPVERMLSEIEKILSVNLRPNEISNVLDAMNEYGSSPELVVKAFSYSAEELGKRDFHYALGVLRKWYMARVYTVEELEKHLSKENKKEKRQGRKNNPFHAKGQGEDRYSQEEIDQLIRRKLRESRER